MRLRATLTVAVSREDLMSRARHIGQVVFWIAWKHNKSANLDVHKTYLARTLSRIQAKRLFKQRM